MEMGRLQFHWSDIVSTSERSFNCEIQLSYTERCRSIKLLHVCCEYMCKIPNFMIITNPEDFALITALYRSSIDGRRFMYEAILSEDGEYEIPTKFTSRSAEILQVYLKSLGVRMETIIDDSEYIGEAEHSDEVVGYKVGNKVIFCTIDEMYYLNKMSKVYKRYMKEHPNEIDDTNEVWEYVLENLPFKKKLLTDNIINLFKNNLEAFSQV